jgi:NAD(P)-dependent dehydrogenase (short-subunit alcohol dehydrogenase family)
MTMFRPELLAGRAVALAGAHDPMHEGLLALGARVEVLVRTAGEREIGEWARARSPLDAVVYDAAPAFGEGGQAGLRAASVQAWDAVSEVVNGALIPGARGGKAVLIAPPPGRAFAHAARAALENLARTLSVEWARYGITATMIAPGGATSPAQLTELACFLVSPAGDYFSGCRFSLSVGDTAA